MARDAEAEASTLEAVARHKAVGDDEVQVDQLEN